MFQAPLCPSSGARGHTLLHMFFSWSLRMPEGRSCAPCRGCYSTNNNNSLYTAHMTCLLASQDSSQHIKWWQLCAVIYGLSLLKMGTRVPETCWANGWLINNFCIKFFFFFFIFYWLYNPGWVSVSSTILFHSCLSSTFALQPIIFILFRSSSTWSIHLNLGLPASLVLYGVHSVIFLVVLVFSILITWAAHLSLCDFINFIISSCFTLCLNSYSKLVSQIIPQDRN